MWDEFCKDFAPSSGIYEPVNAKNDLLELADNFDKFRLAMEQLADVSGKIADGMKKLGNEF